MGLWSKLNFIYKKRKNIYNVEILSKSFSRLVCSVNWRIFYVRKFIFWKVYSYLRVLRFSEKVIAIAIE